LDRLTIAVDAMGGDHGPSVTVPAALLALKMQPGLHVILVGNTDKINAHLKLNNATSSDSLIVHHASQEVGMNELPAQALRSKKDSSMRVAINLVRDKVADACVSAGNTGALMATARFVLKTLPGVDRPAIIYAFPTMKEDVNVRVLDLGANVDSSPEHLFQFGVMGSELTAAVDNIPKPTVGLLNIGEEAIKGNELVKQTAQLFLNSDAVNYVGYVEGDAIYKAVADVIVCDGFVGNVVLKTSEGLAKLISQYIKQAFNQNWLTRLSGLAAIRVLKSLRKRIDPARYNGASLVGLQGIVIKSHGGASAIAFANAIHEAALEVTHNIPGRIGSRVSQLLQNRDEK
jgi:phosphate acyltransferase